MAPMRINTRALLYWQTPSFKPHYSCKTMRDAIMRLVICMGGSKPS